MRVFLTGGGGYVGRHIAEALAGRGHAVSGVVRSERSAAVLRSLGAQALMGDLGRPETYLGAAAEAEAIVHAGFEYDDRGEERPEIDRAAVAAFLSLAGSGPRAFIYTASVFRYASPDGGPFDETTAVAADASEWRVQLENEVLRANAGDFATAAVRLGWVHGAGGGTLRQAVAPLAGRALPARIAANRVPLVHVTDAAADYVRTLEQGRHGPVHACRRPLLTVRELAARAAQAFPAEGGPLDPHAADIFARDCPAVSIYEEAVDETVQLAKLDQSLREDGP